MTAQKRNLCTAIMTKWNLGGKLGTNTEQGGGQLSLSPACVSRVGLAAPGRPSAAGRRRPAPRALRAGPAAAPEGTAWAPVMRRRCWLVAGSPLSSLVLPVSTLPGTGACPGVLGRAGPGVRTWPGGRARTARYTRVLSREHPLASARLDGGTLCRPPWPLPRLAVSAAPTWSQLPLPSVNRTRLRNVSK